MLFMSSVAECIFIKMTFHVKRTLFINDTPQLKPEYNKDVHIFRLDASFIKIYLIFDHPSSTAQLRHLILG